jgi:uncharacterized protein (DUF58 family)
MIFDESTLRKLTNLTLVARQVRVGMLKGERRSTKRGTSIEFADYRNYAPGDDLRQLDWNVYARLDRPFIKLMEEEEDLSVHILLDGSESMGWGEDIFHKFTYALRLSAALGAIALNESDQLTVAVLQRESSAPHFGPTRGAGQLFQLLSYLEVREAAGTTDLTGSIHDYLKKPKRSGLVFLLSDLFSPGGYFDGIIKLLERGHEVILIHILAPDEIEPLIAGDLRLIDVETNAFQEVSVDNSMRSIYQEQVHSWMREINQRCIQHEVRYLPVITSQPWEQVVLRELRVGGVVR